MNRLETAKILSVLRASYPKFYAGMIKKELEDIVSLWTEMFTDEPYEAVGAAVKALIASDSKGFPPVIGQVKSKIRELFQPREMTEIEAWQMIHRALQNSAYGSTEEFSRLPADLQQLVGSPAQLREWAMMDAETVESVVSSNFQRSYKIRARQNAEYKALPSDIRQMVDNLAAGMPSMEALPAETEQESLQKKYRALEAARNYGRQQ